VAGRATPTADVGRPGPLERLLVRSGSGDAQAFAELYDRLAPRVFGTVACLLGDDAASENITCEAFVEAWRRAPTYDQSRSSAAAWMLVIAHRMAVRASRLSPRPAGRIAPVTCIDGSAQTAAGLTDAQAQAVQLAWFCGLDHRQIEEELGSDMPATTLIDEALGRLASIGQPR
jgi:RNA polymerase sigma-70 factor (ECF subfamily)